MNRGPARKEAGRPVQSRMPRPECSPAAPRPQRRTTGSGTGKGAGALGHARKARAPVNGRSSKRPYQLPARHRALRDRLVAPLDLHDPLLEQLAEDARGVQPLEAADRVEVLE